MKRALLVALLLLSLAGCADDKISADDVAILNQANQTVSKAFEAAGQAVVKCSRTATTEKAAAACVDDNFAKVEPAVQAALVDYDAVLLKVAAAACKSAVRAYRTDLNSGGELVGEARRVALELDWDRLSAIGNQMQTTFVADLKADEQKLISSCALDT